MYSILIKIHVWTSALFIVIAIFVCFHSVRGLIFKKDYTKTNYYSELLFILFLYLGLILGIVLYFFLDPENKPKMLSLDEAHENAELRFWAIEHFCVMLFALVLAQIGKVFTGKNLTSISKYKYAVFYYGIATIITLFSSIKRAL